ncbi:MAG: ATP-binding protein [Spirochaetes bacterium]|nr:MAG: ATP-binding protein [Spirochaetota bacterium]
MDKGEFMAYNLKMYDRVLNLSRNYSSFLFGARSTGKTTYLQQYFSPDSTYILDLLDVEIEDRLSRKPSLLTAILDQLDSKYTHIIIDEIQKVPALLDIIHQYMQKNENRFFFILTGSSAKKLKSGGADLLAGRAFLYNMFPLTYFELDSSFDITDYLHYGGLPGVYHFTDTADKERYLKSYGLMYLKEEVWNEHLIRKLNPFRSFLELASAANGEIINYKKISSQIKIDAKTVQSYYEILVDTLLGFTLNAYSSSIRKQLILSPKFYFIDPGIKRALDNTLKTTMTPGTFAYGKSFEHFIITQIFFINHYHETDFKLFYLKTKDGAEIDLIVEKPDKSLICIEIKSTDESSHINTTSLGNLAKDLKCTNIYCFSQDLISRKEKGIVFIHWQAGIEQIFK